MDYIKSFRKFITSQYLYAGIRMTAAVIIPAVILYRMDLLKTMIAIPLGALCVSLTDTPGPFHHRRNSLFASVGINFAVMMITSVLRFHPVLIIAGIIVFGMFFSLIGVYGNRINSIGLIALLVFIFNIDGHIGQEHNFLNALWFSAGGLFYALLSLLQHTLRPYTPIQQLLGECIMETADYLKLKALWYDKNPDYTSLNSRQLQYHITIQQQHNDIRELLFKTRTTFRESTTKGRVLMLIFLDTIDLFERIIISPQGFEELHKKFDDSGILEKFYYVLTTFGNELHEIGLAVQTGIASKKVADIDEIMQETIEALEKLLNEKLPTATENFAELKQILYTIEDIAEQIKRLHLTTTYDRKIGKRYKPGVELDRFVHHQELNPGILVENLSFRSSHFRHAVRLTFALLVGYIISLLFTLGHGYWILLTITTIIKPAYSLTKKRNFERLTGTLTGAAIGFISLYFIKNESFLFVVMLFAMIISYSFLRLNYFVSTAGITLYVLLSFNFINPASVHTALVDRVIDTAIGSVIAFVVSIFVLPVWEHEQITNYIIDAIKTNREYFKAVAGNFSGKIKDVTAFKLARKNAFVALANLSDNFQKMISEPKNKQPDLQLYHQFVASNHTLTSSIASLSYYAQRTEEQYFSDEFETLTGKIDEHFLQAKEAVEKNTGIADNYNDEGLFINEKTDNLFTQKRKNSTDGSKDEITTVRKAQADRKSIERQFDMIDSIIVDEVKILQKIYAEKQ